MGKFSKTKNSSCTSAHKRISEYIVTPYEYKYIESWLFISKRSRHYVIIHIITQPTSHYYSTAAYIHTYHTYIITVDAITDVCWLSHRLVSLHPSVADCRTHIPSPCWSRWCKVAYLANKSVLHTPCCKHGSNYSMGTVLKVVYADRQKLQIKVSSTTSN